MRHNLYGNSTLGTQMQSMKTANSMTIDGTVCDKETIRILTKKIRGSKAIAVMGKAGVGKTYTIVRIIEYLIKQVYPDIKTVLVYVQLFMYRHIKDSFIAPVLKQGDLVWVVSPWVKKVEQAKKEGKSVVLIIDEVTQLDPQSQASLLAITETENKTIRLEVLGKQIDLDQHDKVVLIGNIDTKGVFELIEPLDNRVNQLNWPMPPQSVIVDIFEKKFKDQNQDSLQTTDKSIADIELGTLPVTRSVIEIIVHCLTIIGETNNNSVSLRDILEYLETYKNSKTIDEAIDDIENDIQINFGSTEDSSFQSELDTIFFELEQGLRNIYTNEYY